VVDDELADSESLQQEYLKHKDDPGLFNQPGVFKKISD